MNRLAWTVIMTSSVMLAAVGTVPGTAAAERELRLAHFMAPTHPYHPLVFEWLDAQVQKRTNGTLKVRIFPGGALGAGPAEQFDRAVDGVADITMGLHGYTAARFPRTLLLEYPGVAKSPDKAAEGLWNAFELLRPEYERVRVLGLWTITPGVLFSRSKPIRNLEDLAGMKVRVPSSVGGEVIEAWGGTPVFLPVTEVYTAMQSGVVDATLIDPGAALAFKLNEVSASVTVGMDSMLSTFFLAMNHRSWDSLSDEHKKALAEVSGPVVSNRAYEIWNGISKKGLELMRTTKTVIELSEEQAAPFNAASRNLLNRRVEALEKEGIPAKQIVKAMSLAN